MLTRLYSDAVDTVFAGPAASAATSANTGGCAPMSAVAALEARVRALEEAAAGVGGV